MLIISPASFTTWLDMVPLVLEHAPQVSTFLAMDHLKDAAGEFFRHSRIWRSGNVTLLTTVAAQQDYTYTAPTNALVHAVQSAWIDGCPIDIAGPGDIDEMDPDYTSDEFAIGARGSTLVLTPPPVSAGIVVKGTLSFELSSTAVGIPTEAYTEWRRQIAAGAAAELVAQPMKPWSNANAATYLRGLFDDGVRTASNQAGPTQGRPLRVRPA